MQVSDGDLVRSHSADAVYLILNGTRHHVPDAETFNYLQYSPALVLHLPQAEIDRLADGASLPSLAPRLDANYNNIGAPARRPVPSEHGLLPALDKDKRSVFIGVSVAAAVLLAAASILILPYLLPYASGLSPQERTTAIAAARTALIQTWGAMGVIAGLFFTARTIAVTRRGLAATTANQISERYARSVELMNSANVKVRLAGILALARIGRIASDERSAVATYLATLCRLSPDSQAETCALLAGLSDLRAAGFASTYDLTGMTVDAVERPEINLSNSTFARCLFPSTKGLSGANLAASTFIGATLQDVDLRFANLNNVLMRDCVLGRIVTGCNLARSRLTDAVFVTCDLRNSSLVGVRLIGTVFIWR